MSFKKRLTVWDLPTRLFHWLLVASVAAGVATGILGKTDSALLLLHGKIGLAIVGLLVFRLVWGVIGSTYARFLQFIPGPGRVIAYLCGQWHGLGHNPLGAFSVLALLGIMLLQAGSGLVSTDDAGFSGPLINAGFVATLGEKLNVDISHLASNWHRGPGFWVIIGLVALHVLSIVFYALVKKDFLLIPMITGKKEVADPTLKSASGGGWIAFVVAVLVAAGVVWLVSGVWITPPEVSTVEPAPW